jgi:hypothetical protein
VIHHDEAKLADAQKVIDDLKARISISDELEEEMADLLLSDRVERTGDLKKDLMSAYLMATSTLTRN